MVRKKEIIQNISFEVAGRGWGVGGGEGVRNRKWVMSGGEACETEDLLYNI